MKPKAGHMRTGAAGPSQTVKVRRTYNASVAAAFDAWTNPEALEKWFGPTGYRAEVLSHDLRVGGGWRFLMVAPDGEAFHHFGTFVEISPPHRLAFTWASEEQVEGWRDENGDPTLVTVDFGPRADGVEVRITHERLQSDTARGALTGGWAGGLEALDDFLK
jgi:uncharacterized protein YndB with AHSA1/START domain